MGWDKIGSVDPHAMFILYNLYHALRLAHQSHKNAAHKYLSHVAILV
jgi:hypothetical protein